nr:aldehyde dehydrogenase family protein [Salinicola halimionae]
MFGPVFAVYRFRTEAEVIERANVSRAFETGMVILNTSSVGTASVPFGGVKQSGYGREGSFYGIEEYVDVKYVLMSGWISRIGSP